VVGMQKSTPGPADYCVKETRETTGPRFVRPGPPPTPRAQVPAPNAYNMPSARDDRSVPIGKRFKEKAGYQTPGPGQYDVPHADLYLPGRFRAGRTFGRRYTAKGVMQTPGPADYDAAVKVNYCGCVKGGNCGTTISHRRPDWVPTFAVIADNNDC